MKRRRVAVLLYPGCIFFEIAAAVELLARTYEIGYYTPDGSTHSASNGSRLLADGTFDDAARSHPACVLVPGGDPQSIFEDGLADACLHAAHREGAWLAGICAGSLVLARTGLLRGHRITHNYTAEHADAAKVEATAPYWQGARFERADVVIDRPIITAQHWAHAAFAAAVGEAVGVPPAQPQAGTLGKPASAIASSDSS